jgi:FKBP-type peptidyl-prolyl cis-trans isomerase SlyD
VVLDGNHPLAGIAIRLHMQVEDVRAATADELTQRSTGSHFFRIEPPHVQGDGGTQLH